MAVAAEHEKKAGELAAVPAKVVHRAVLKQGRDELARSSAALAWSGVAGGLSISLSFLTESLLRAHLPEAPWTPLITRLGYPVGFLVVVLGRQQLFTENTLTAVLPVLDDRSHSTFLQMVRLWAVVLLANVIGAHLAAGFFAWTPAVDPAIKQAMEATARSVVRGDFLLVFTKAIVAGWLIALVVWLKAAVEFAEVASIAIPTYVISLGGFSHVVAGSVEVVYLVMLGAASWMEYLTGFFLPALLGNCVGGVMLVAALNHAQVVQEKE